MKKHETGFMALKKFATQIDEDVLGELREFSDESGRSISKVVTVAVAEYLERARIRPVFTDAMKEVADENEELLRRLAK